MPARLLAMVYSTIISSSGQAAVLALLEALSYGNWDIPQLYQQCTLPYLTLLI